MAAGPKLVPDESAIPMPTLPYLAGYPPEIQARAESMLGAGELGALLRKRYPERHQVRTNKALQAYVQELKARAMRNAPPLVGVRYDDRLHVVHGALGLHTTTTRVQGPKLRKRREMRVASLFKDTPPEFLRMIVVHELAHMKHAEHDREFYKLCRYMEPDYHQLELDLRLYLTVPGVGGRVGRVSGQFGFSPRASALTTALRESSITGAGSNRRAASRSDRAACRSTTASRCGRCPRRS